MFDNYDEEAQRSIYLAQNEALLRGALDVRPEHLLLGILQVNSKSLVDIATSVGASLEVIEIDLVDQVALKMPRFGDELPLAEESMTALTNASNEATLLAHSTIGVGHLVLGLLSMPTTRAAQILEAHGFSLQRIRPLVPEGLDRSDLGRPLSPNNCDEITIIWDPAVLDLADYAVLVKALGDLVRANGGKGIVRGNTAAVTVGKPSGVRV